MRSPIASCRRLGPLILALCLYVCPARVAAANPAPSASASGVVHTVTEKAFDGPQVVTPDTRRVDANSDLEITFAEALADVSPAMPSPEWARATELLARVQEVLNERAAIMVRYQQALRSSVPSPEVQQLKRETDAFNTKAADRPDEWQAALGMSDADWARIVSGSFDGKRNRSRPYANLARWLSGEIVRLNHDDAQFARTRTVQITVQAFHSALIGGSTKAIHVEGYDNLSSGDYQPIDRLGVRMTAEEQRQLAMKVQMYEKVAHGIGEAMNQRTQYLQFIREEMDKVRTLLADLQEQLVGEDATWGTDIDQTVAGKKLAELAAGNFTARNDQERAAVRQAAAELRKEIKAFKKEADGLAGLARSARELHDSIPLGQAASLTEVIASVNGFVGRVKAVLAAASAVTAPMANWGNRLADVRHNLTLVSGYFSNERQEELLPRAAQAFLKDFSARFPKTEAAIRALADLMASLTGDSGLSGAMDSLADTQVEPIWRDAPTAVKGTIELPRVGLAPGDRVTVKVRYREADTNRTSGRVIEQDDYKLETVLIGWHRKIDATLIFARGLRGDNQEQQWKPNVAAAVTWHYLHREQGSLGRRAWNGFNPGLGLHLASLDQGEAGVEFGIGATLSLWDGILQVGYGVNLNNRERPYAYIGLGLLETLDKAKGGFK